MPRQYVVTSATTGTARDSLNSFLIGLFGDDPGSEEVPVANAYLVGEDPAVATHSFGCMNVSQADSNSIQTFCGATEGCAAYEVGPTAGGASYDFWAIGLDQFALKPAVPVS